MNKKYFFILILFFVSVNSIFAKEFFEHAGDYESALKEVREFYGIADSNASEKDKNNIIKSKKETILQKWVAVSEDKDGNYIMDGKTYSKDDKTVKWVTETVKDENGKEKVKVIGAWVDYVPNEADKSKNTYIISHGMNDNYYADWISESANLIQEQYKKGLILSINWDEYSGRSNIKDSSGKVLESKDKNFFGSTWINAVSTVLAEQLANYKIKSVMAHSYGTHLFEATFSRMTNKNTLTKDPMSFIALDPAGETVTWTGDKKGKTTTIWSDDKRSKNWDIPDNITTELYKSSVFLSAEEIYGDYSMLIAAPNSIVPKAIAGDWENPFNFVSNHSRAALWLPKMLAKSLGSSEYKKQDLVGGWFNKQIDNVRGNTKNKQAGWDGVVNSDTSVKSPNPELEYVVPKNISIKSYADVFVAEAQSKLGSKSEWENTVLKPGAYTLFKLFHGNAKVGETACDTSQMAAIKTSDDTITVYDANDDQYYNYTISTGKIEKINASSENVLDDINEAINGNGASTTNENSITGSIDSVTNDNADIENAINGVLNSKNNSSTKLDKIIEKGKELVNKYITLDNVKKVAQEALDKLLKRYPAVDEIIQKLGDIIKYGKNLFKLVKGLLGGENFINLLKNCSMLKNLLAGGIQKIGELLKDIVGNLATNLISKLCNFVSKAVNNLLSKVSNFKLDPEQIKKWIENAIDKTLHKSTTWVSPRVDSFSLSDGVGESKNSNNSSSSGASILGGQQSVNAN